MSHFLYFSHPSLATYDHVRHWFRIQICIHCKMIWQEASDWRNDCSYVTSFYSLVEDKRDHEVHFCLAPSWSPWVMGSFSLDAFCTGFCIYMCRDHRWTQMLAQIYRLVCRHLHDPYLAAETSGLLYNTGCCFVFIILWSTKVPQPFWTKVGSFISLSFDLWYVNRVAGIIIYD